MRSAGRVKRLEKRLRERQAHCDECQGSGRVVVVYEDRPGCEDQSGCPSCGRKMVVRIVYGEETGPL